MRINPYLNFNGQCREAFEFYAKCLGGKISGITSYGESPLASKTPPDQYQRILHAMLTVGDQVLQGSDSAPNNYHAPQGYSISLDLKDAAETDRIFAGLAEGGTVRVPLAKTFWAERFGMVVDRFGTPWMLNCYLPDHQPGQ